MRLLLEIPALLWWLADDGLIDQGPFDRMLIAQAVAEGLTVLTHDKRFADYDVTPVTNSLIGRFRQSLHLPFPRSGQVVGLRE